ncbi:tryptophan 7-halogenase [Streptomyces kaniharaensis]|uniref:Tryptophan 7-halogenase n=1 Tax=Streptomyces kaniharaensis TaxID=212423 RepID=A0A6N7KRJ6_9ACTN|nr:FAD-dependent oxidoreductase [Streptomyces kaniharaensis]MQS12978.1 tryptophan 7-halogenase [Streptomyces kaniharaensis]
MTTGAELPAPLDSIVIAGGTLTAWIAAARLASAFRGTVRVTVVETAERPSAQVTALAPAFRRDLFDRLGTPENIWMRAASASFNAATRYVGWRADAVYLPNPAGGQDCEGFPLTDFWQLRRRTGHTLEPVDHACSVVPPLLDAGKSPRWLDGRTAFPYGWHADTAMLTHFLRRTAVQTCGVRLHSAEILGADRDGTGMVTALHTTRGRIEADLFVDCTGRAARLLAGILGEPFQPAGDRLPADRTATVTLPHDTARHGIEPYTTVTTRPEGHLWRRPLPGRHTIGLVYASARTTPAEAERILRTPAGAVVTHTATPAGRLRRSWVRNCLALGTAAASADPLDEDHAATLTLLDRLIRDLPSLAGRETPAARFNATAAALHEQALDLARLRRITSPYAAPAPHPDQLRPVLDAHATGLAPTPDDLPLRTLLTTLSPHTANPPPSLAHHPHAVRAAEDAFTRIKRHQRTLLETLPDAHIYLSTTQSLPSPALT